MLDPSFLRPAMTAAAMITELTVLTVLGVVLGGWLDRRLDTAPWLLAVLAFTGFALGLVRLFRYIERTQREDEGPPDDPA